MSHIIDKARIKQPSLVITLLDLKNAFGEVHHNLIKSVLSYHHVPEKIQSLISSLYINFKTSIITDKFVTPAISVKRGVLQCDCLSPLLFNMCFNTFIQYIKAKKNSNNLVSLPIANQTVCLPQSTGFSLQTMLQSSQTGRKKTSYS